MAIQVFPIILWKNGEEWGRMGTYDTADDAIRFLKERQLIKKLKKEPIREYDESTVNELIEVIQKNYG